jgi:hypothetical protein
MPKLALGEVVLHADPVHDLQPLEPLDDARAGGRLARRRAITSNGPGIRVGSPNVLGLRAYFRLTTLFRHRAPKMRLEPTTQV